MNDQTDSIRKLFPDKGHRIDFLIENDPDFLIMCEDYDACVNALGYWARSTEPEAESRISEYSILIEQLEEEIYKSLSSRDSPAVD